jgi:lipopolysaccharide biosynthesis glycosyltransferase
MGIFVRNKGKRVIGVDKPKKMVIDAQLKIEDATEITLPGKKSLKSKIGEPQKPTINLMGKKQVISSFDKGVQPDKKTFKSKDEVTYKKEVNKILNTTQINCSFELKSNSLPSTYAVTTILNDSFAEYFYVFVTSFLEHNRWFDGDIIIMHNDDFSFLSNKNINKISKLYSNIIFRKIETTKDYLYVIKEFKNRVNPAFHRFTASILTIETFNITGYDKILYLDADTLVINDIKELFLAKSDIVVTNDTSDYITTNQIKLANDSNSQLKLNGGFLLVDKEFNQKSDHVMNIFSEFDKIPDITFLDQSILNYYLKRYEVLFINANYNLLKRCFNDSKKELLKKYDKNIKIIHYVGEKPWQIKQKDFEKSYTEIEKFWLNSYNKCKGVIGVEHEELNVISSGIRLDELRELLPEVKNGKNMSANWGYKFSKVCDVDFYLCSTNEAKLAQEINADLFKPKTNWLLTTNVYNNLVKSKGAIANNLDPFYFIMDRSIIFKQMLLSRVNNKKINTPTSGIVMLFLSSFMEIKKINIIGYNLFNVKNSDGSFKQFGDSKFVNPYIDDKKPHSIECDITYAILALNNLIKNNTEIKFYHSEIINDVYNMILDGYGHNQIIDEIKNKYRY